MVQNLRTILITSLFFIIGIVDCFAQPATPGAITGTSPVCQQSTGRTYSVVAVPTATSYTWSYTGTGATITAGSTSRSITVRYSATATSGDWTVIANNGQGSSSASPAFSVVVDAAPAQPGAFTTSTTAICQGQTGISYGVAAVSGATSYVWNFTGAGETITGSTNTVSVDFDGSSTSGNMTVASNNGTCSSAVRSLAITVGSSAPTTPGAITGTSPVCQQATGRTYSVVAVSGATSYTWAYTGTGASITSGSTTRAITVTYSSTATSGDWTVVANNGCGSSTASAAFSVVVDVAPAQPGAFTTSTTAICQGQTGVAYGVAAVSGATSYVWNFTGAGETITGSTNAVTVDFDGSSTSGNMTVASSNGTCSSAVRSLAITVGSSAPTTPGAITGTSPVCQQATGRTYSVVAVSGATSYTWAYTGAGATITSGSTSRAITVRYSSTATAGDWTVVANNGCGSSTASAAFSVLVDATPAQPGAFTTSTTAICQGQTGVAYGVAAVSGATSYVWDFTGAGETITGSTNSVTVDFDGSSTSGNMTVASSNGTCTSAVRSLAITVGSSTPTTPGSITGVSPVCQQATGQAYSVVAVSGATSYTWAYTGTGATITSGSTTRAITVTYSSTATAGDWTVIANNGCGSSASSTPFGVVVNATPDRPNSFTTSTTAICQGQTGVAYGVAAVSGATSYVWNFTGTGASFSGTNSNTESVDFSGSATSGSITVASSNGTCTSVVRSLTITISGSAPTVPGAITGTTEICKPSTGNVYSVVAVSGATSYTWAYTGTGATITSGSTSRSITVSYTALATSGNWSVMANNGCGSSSASSPLSVNMNSALSAPGTITGVALVEQNSTGHVYSVAAVVGATSYTWSYSGAGATITNGATTNSITVSYGNDVTSGNWTVTATNACGTSSASSPFAVSVDLKTIFRSATTGDFSDISTWEASSDGLNWIPATVIPNATSTLVTIESGDNVTLDVNATITDLVIVGTLTASNTNTLTINGSFTNNGTLNHTAGVIEFSGTTDEDITGSALFTEFYNLHINKSVNASITVLTSVRLKEKLSFGTDATNQLFIDNGGGGFFTFLSNASSTAHIDRLSAPLPILTGAFTCQRYFPAQNGKYLFMLSVPVTNAFMSDLQPNSYDFNNYPTDGLYITGPFTGTNTGNGLTTGSSSAIYNASTGLYAPYPQSGGDIFTTAMTIGKAYRMSVKDGGTAYPTVIAKTLDVSGSLVSPGSFNFSGLVNVAGTKPFSSGTFPNITTGGWNLIGNPYMSDISIDFSDNNAWSNSNIATTSYIYDAASLQMVACASGVGHCVLPAFQGFWVQATGASPSVTIHEDAKISGTNTATIKRVAQGAAASKNYLPIHLSSSSSATTSSTYIRYVEGANWGYDKYDGFKLGAGDRSSLPGTTVSVYTKALDEAFYEINAKEYGLLSDTTELHVILPVGESKLNFSDLAFLEPIYKISLIDKYTNTITDINSNPVYNFTVSSDSNSWGPRFRVVFEDIVNVSASSRDVAKIGTNAYASVYPSPGSSDKINVLATDVNDGDVEFTVYDMLGRVLFSSKVTINDKKAFQVFDLSRILQSGIYNTVIKTNNLSYSQKLIIK